MLGGLVDSEVKGDLWKIESSGSGLNCFEITTSEQGPGPRFGHASLLVQNIFIVFGGDARDGNELDDTLYFLNTSSRQWFRANPGTRPVGRYGHSLNIIGSRLYVFGGQNNDQYLNDHMLLLDLNQLQNPANNWEHLVQRGQVPPARANHTIVNFNDKLYLFGGTNGRQWFNDIWVYDYRVNRWTELVCVGLGPAAREGHTATVVNDMMFIFGGRVYNGVEFGDLYALSITERCWLTINIGSTPSPRPGHSMTAMGKQVMVMAGTPSTAPEYPTEFSKVYILDTSRIEYPDIMQWVRSPAWVNQEVQDPLAMYKIPWYPDLSANQKNLVPWPQNVIQQTVTGTNLILQDQLPNSTSQGIPRKEPPTTQQFSHPRSQWDQSPNSPSMSGIGTQSATTLGDNRIQSQGLASNQEATFTQKQHIRNTESAVGQVNSSGSLRIRSAIDLVRDSYRDTQIESSFTKHVIWVPNRSAGQRRIRREELWRREYKLGSGSFGHVWLESCTEGEETGSLRAVKEVAKSTTSTKIEHERELEALANFSNSKYMHCFLGFFGWWESPTAIFMSMEYVPDGDLQRLLTVPFPESITWEIVVQILEGLEFMHENGFIHRDLKPGNILVLQQSPTWWVKIADFGITERALESTATMHSVVGTHGYLAPEVLGFVEPSDAQGSPYTSAVDIWALGEIIFRLITKKSTFSNPRLLAKYSAAQIPLPYTELDRVGASKDIKDFLKKAMAAHPSQRLSTQDATRHPWVAQSQPPQDQLVLNPFIPPGASEDTFTMGDPSNGWSAASNSRSLTNFKTGV